MRNAAVALSILFLIAATAGSLASEPPQLEHEKAQLAPLQMYVGAWRGTGLPKRGSNQGAWRETSEWTWRFAEGHAFLVGSFQPGKFFERFEIRPAASGQGFLVQSFEQASVGQTMALFHGQLHGDEFVALAQEPSDNRPERITIRLVAGGDRMLVLYERRLSEDSFARLAEVGSTREGSSFAKRATNGPECVVTGGLGTIAVEHQGKTYFVCCGGCKDLFDEDPAGVLAEYRARKAAERERQAKD